MSRRYASSGRRTKTWQAPNTRSPLNPPPRKTTPTPTTQDDDRQRSRSRSKPFQSFQSFQSFQPSIPPTTTSTPSRYARSVSSSDDDDSHHYARDRFDEHADFRFDQIPTNSLSRANIGRPYLEKEKEEEDWHGTPVQSPNYYTPRSIPSGARRDRNRTEARSSRSVGRHNRSISPSSSSMPHDSKTTSSGGSSPRSRGSLRSPRSPSSMINGSPNHGPMGAAFHSVLINRVTRTHQGGKNMGARKYSSPPSPPPFLSPCTSYSNDTE